MATKNHQCSVSRPRSTCLPIYTFLCFSHVSPTVLFFSSVRTQTRSRSNKSCKGNFTIECPDSQLIQVHGATYLLMNELSVNCDHMHQLNLTCSNADDKRRQDTIRQACDQEQTCSFEQFFPSRTECGLTTVFINAEAVFYSCQNQTTKGT